MFRFNLHRILPFLAAGLAHVPCGAQDSRNVSLIGRLDPEPVHYAGCWGWTVPDGSEYALLGTYNGTSVISIDDSLNISEADFVPGPPSNWREITVVGNHAYVVSEGKGAKAGMQVIALSYLPDSVSLVHTYTATFSSAHMISSDSYTDSAYVFVSGTDSTGGLHILNVSDPLNPKEAGRYAPYYVHDTHVRNNTAYVAAMYNGTLDIVDIAVKSSPTLTGQLTYPAAFTHSSSATEDGRYLFVTDEKDGLFARMWDVTDAGNPAQVGRYTANPASLVHNPYIRGDFAYISHNTEGLRVVDISDPAVPAEVGWYDTWPGASGGFHGLWSAYPYFPSGKIIGGNREDGLYVFRFNGTKAGRIYGLVLDSLTGAPISGATVRIDTLVNAGVSGIDGRFGVGGLPPGASGGTVTASAPGYYTKTADSVMFAQGDSLWMTFELVDSSWIGMAESGRNLPGRLEVYPNPLRTGSLVRFTLKEKAYAVVEVRDIAGRRMAVLADGLMYAGRHEVGWSGNRTAVLPAGMYFVTLNADGVVVTVGRVVME